MLKAIIFSFIFLSSTLAKDEISFSGKFHMSIDESRFIYKDLFIKEAITIKKCNKNILASVFDLFSSPRKISSFKKIIQNPQRVTYLRNKVKLSTPKGSKIHHNLETINKKIIGYISRARIACKK